MKSIFLTFVSLLFLSVCLQAQEINNTNTIINSNNSTDILKAKHTASTTSKKTSDIESVYIKNIKSNPNKLGNYYKLIGFYQRSKQHEKALQWAMEAINKIGANVTLYLIVGDENKSMGYYKRALIAYQYALKLNPYSARTYNRIGLALLKLERFQTAKDAFKAALYFIASKQDNQTKGVYYNNLGVAYEALQDYKNAYKYFKLATQYFPGYARAWDNMRRVKAYVK